MTVGSRRVRALLDPSPFAAAHERAFGAMGRDRIGPAPADLAARHAPRVRDAAIATWRARMVNEHRSSAVFAAMLPQLIEASVSFDVQTATLRAATDEIFHAALCGDVVAAFGGVPEAEAEGELTPLPRHDGVDPAERVLRNVLFVGCLSETVAVGLLSEERELATEPWVRAVLEVILADEVAHARLGWQFVAARAPSLDRAARDRVSAYLRVAFGYLEARELELLPVSPPLPDADLRAREAVGLCGGDGARDVFYGTLSSVIVPRLTELGFDAARAWEERRWSPPA